MIHHSTPPRPDDGSGANIAEVGGHGGRTAAVLSALAFAFSGLSFYESSMKSAALEVYVPPVIHYARDSGGDVELFAIPVTIVNGGARTGTVLSMELGVENLKEGAEPKTKRYYSAYFGEHPKNPDETNRAFAPLSIAGRATFTETVRFYPMDNPLPKLVDDAGNYRFSLKLNTAGATDFLSGLWPAPPIALSFEMALPWISEQSVGFQRATAAMHAADWKPASNTAPK